MDEDNERKKVSMVFSKELEKLGYSKHKLETKASEVKLLEHLANNRGNIKMFATGSSTEGVDISGSDRDTMVVLDGVISVWPPKDNDEISRSNVDNNFVVVIEKSSTRACYAKLRLVKENTTDNLFKCLGGTASLCVTSESGEVFLSNKLFPKQATFYITNLLESSPDHIVRVFHVHGPCTSFENVVYTTTFDADFAFCIHCEIIHDDMLPSGNRMRDSKWLHDVIGRVKKNGYHLVAVGSKVEEVDDLDWRISFALIERELVWSLDDMYCKCYVLLKMVVKQFITPIVTDVLSSYMLKTTISWLREEEALQQQEESLIDNIIICLQKLSGYLQTKTLPHYIIPENNLLYLKVDDDTMRRRLIETLEELAVGHWKHLLQCGALSFLREVWREFQPDVYSFYRHARHPNLKPLMYKDALSFRSAQSLFLSVCHFSVTPVHHIDMLKSLSSLPADVNKPHASFLTKVIANRVLFSAADGRRTSNLELLYTVIDRLVVDKDNSKYHKEYKTPRPSVDSMWRASSFDVCTLKLQLAVKYFKHGDYKSAYKTLQDVMASYKPHVLYIGLCGPEELSEEDIIEYLCFITTSNELPLEQKISECLTFDYIICRYDPVLPVFNLERMLWSETEIPMCIHPRVMMYYLMFLVHYVEGREDSAQVTLSFLLIHVLGTAHRSQLYGHIAWNLVGHGYFLLGKYKKAARAFRVSLKARPTVNPALYYLGNC